MADFAERKMRDDHVQALYAEFAVLQAVAWGSLYLAQQGYDGLHEQAALALLHEGERVQALFDELCRAG